MSDFPKAIARVSEGFCPLCDGDLDQDGKCDTCAIGWGLDTSMGASQPMLRPSRSLTPAETKALFNRPTTSGEDD